MSRLLSDLLDDSGASGRGVSLLGSPPKLLKGSPSEKAGQIRPGHLSVDAKLRKKRQVKPMDQTKPVSTAKLANDNTNKRRSTSAPGSAGAGAGSGNTMQRRSVITRTGGGRTNLFQQQRRRAPVPPVPPPPQNTSTRRRALSGLGDPTPQGGNDNSIPFQANATVWVALEPVPLYGQQSISAADSSSAGAKPGGEFRGPQLVYPDGTPAMALFWCPQVNLEAVGFDPSIPGSWYQMRGDPFARNEAGARGWIHAQASRDLFGPSSAGWTLACDYICTERTDRPSPPSDPDPLPDGHFYAVNTDQFSYHYDPPFGQGAAVELLKNRCVSVGGHWLGYNVTREYFACTFDWTGYPPSVAAPIWVWFFLAPEATTIAWQVQQAEIYRADLQDVATAGEPKELPGRAWMDLNFLDAIQTGAHGMPQLITINPDGSASLDRNALAAFMQAHPDWASIMHLGLTNQGMLAIVDDLGSQGGAVVHQGTGPSPVGPAPGGGPTGNANSSGGALFQSMFSNSGDNSGGDNAPPPPPPAPTLPPGATPDGQGGYYLPDGSHVDAQGNYTPAPSTNAPPPQPPPNYNAPPPYDTSGPGYDNSSGAIPDGQGGYYLPDGGYLDAQGNYYPPGGGGYGAGGGGFSIPAPPPGAGGAGPQGPISDGQGGWFMPDGSYLDPDGGLWGSDGSYTDAQGNYYPPGSFDTSQVQGGGGLQLFDLSAFEQGF